METEKQPTQQTVETTKQNLNLARKLRPQTFDQVVGQSIPIKMLKNSLYLKKFFPVYLFAGQRGCGKTTTARVFAAATNCENLTTFQKNPASQKIPCLECESCMAMASAKHPDFIEIDAASHTGVDNVRQIIETSSYMPLSGQKKIYLIDEAHMLSKSAFNAFLKILEDPPQTALFLLATTEAHKFPETVLSRCFQLTFGPVKKNDLAPYLKQLSTQENINIDDDALDALIEETDGSVRDALNLLEQVRFSHDHITLETILNVLGKVSNTIPIQIFSHILKQDAPGLLAFLKQVSFHELSVKALWTMLVELCRAVLWVKYGVETLPNSFNKNFNALIQLGTQCSINRLHSMMQLLWTQEPLFLQTSNKHSFFELVLLQLCEQTPIASVNKIIQTNGAIHGAQATPPPATPAPPSHTPAGTTGTPPNHHVHVQSPPQTPPPVQAPPVQTIPHSDKWERFIQTIKSAGDPMLNSIFVQATFLGFNEKNGSISLQLSNNSAFLRDKVTESKKTWEPPIKEGFGNFSRFDYTQPSTNKTRPPETPPTPPKAPPTTVKNYTPTQHSGAPTYGRRSYEPEINVKNKEKWPLANLIIAHFPGIIKKVKVCN